jgi:hypothetical protein
VSYDCCRTVAIKNWNKRGEVLIFFFEGLTLEGKSMPFVQFCCCLNVYLKLYLRLKFLRFHNCFFSINSMSCLGLFVLFVWIL